MCGILCYIYTKKNSCHFVCHAYFNTLRHIRIASIVIIKILKYGLSYFNYVHHRMVEDIEQEGKQCQLYFQCPVKMKLKIVCKTRSFLITTYVSFSSCSKGFWNKNLFQDSKPYTLQISILKSWFTFLSNVPFSIHFTKNI